MYSKEMGKNSLRQDSVQSSPSTKTDGGWQVLLICPDRGMATELTELLSRDGQAAQVIDSKVYPAPKALAELAAGTPLDLCFLDICSDQEQAFQVLSQLVELPSRLPAVALLCDDNPDRILRCLRKGAAGFLLRPFTAEQLRPALRRIADLHARGRRSPERTGKVYCLIPAKGSSGATTIASNLACQMKLLGAKKVLLADMDPLTSTLSFLLKLQPQYSFVDALAHSGHLDRDLWKALVSSHRGVDVLASPDSALDGAVESQDVSAILEYCRSIYDVVLLDSGGPYGAWNVRLARLSDEVFVVLTAELPAVYAAQRALAYLERNGLNRSGVRILVNRYAREAGLNEKEIETALGVEVFHLLPNDREAAESALMEGRPVSPGSQFGKSLAELAAHLGGRKAPLKKGPQPGGLLSLFSRVTL